MEEYQDFYHEELSPLPVVERQDSDSLSTAALVMIGAAFAAANILLALGLTTARPRLENDQMCGMTTGGKVPSMSNVTTKYDIMWF